jgi:glycosyltransferase involved in cell wall biosynthesis
VFHPNREPAVGLCVFGTAGALSAGGLRKNVGRVVELFRRAFPADDDVRLRVKITPNCPPFEIAADPRIEVLRATLPYSDLARWNRSLTAYVNASFAEGFGLHLLEAMACGVPLVSTHSSGLTEFFDDETGIVVPHTLVETRNEYYRGRWADPDDVAMIAALRRVRDHRAEAASLGEAAAARARRFTWRDTGRLLLAALETHGLRGTR